MCGIAGSINFKLSYPIINQNMFHRGPDIPGGRRGIGLCLRPGRRSASLIAETVGDRYS